MPATNIRRTRPDPIARITRGRETSQIKTQESDDKAKTLSTEEDVPMILSTTE
ncbi:hypothetical protein LCGC14_2924270 [marine sediment metagenome]|uniref:Uncharacterized protein n=1 Tax=marine sediment metagenome TaxID=412755 RepID=A0A0F8XN81_9ZZZZ